MRSIISKITLRNWAPDRVLSWHRHPFAMPVATFVTLFFVGLIGFVAFNGTSLGADDTKVVQLYVDGQSRTIPTRATTVGDMLARADIELHEGDVTEPAVDNAIVSQDFHINVYRARPVTITDNKGVNVTQKVIDSTPNDMAKRAGVKVYPEDTAKIADPDTALKNGIIGTQVVIDRATPTSINLYGNKIDARTHAKTVGELLDQKNIKPIEGDTVQPSRDTPITDNIQIFVTSFGKQLATVEEEIPVPVEKVADPNSPLGTDRVAEAGAPGKKIVTYEIELQNGQEVGRRAIQEVISVQPAKRVISEGTKVVISNPSENIKIGQDLAAQKGWTGSEFNCLYLLWQKESKWNHLSANRNSGATGIPQALPGSKMATAGADWQTNPATQIKWGLGYIERSYRTPCNAWAKSRASGWY
jgi:resuscitation-promoting factor RpfB